MSGREEFAVVRMTLKRLALPSVVLYRPKTDSLHLPPEANDGTVYGRAIAYLVDENGLTYTGTDLVDLGLAAPALLAAFDAQAARIAELEADLAEATKERAEEDAELAKWRAFARKNRCEVCGGEPYRPLLGHDPIHGDVHGAEEPCPMNCGEFRLRFGSIDAEVETIALQLTEALGPAYRARIAREFLDEVEAGETSCTSFYASAYATQERWEAAAKEGS